MGATNCPETPRQKMIGMMYLVLTAMLALNVSVEIINAFVTVGDSMEATNKNFSNKINDTYALFEKAYTNDPAKIETSWKSAKEVRSLTKEMLNYIENVKVRLVSQVEGITEKEAEKILKEKGAQGIQKKDDYTVPTDFFIGQSEDGSKGEARKLKDKLLEYKKKVKSILGNRAENVNLGLDFDGNYVDADGKKLTWEMKHFYHTVIVADLVILNKYKAEVLNAELDAVNDLYASVDAQSYKFDNVVARVIPKTTYILQGSQYEADIFIAANDSRTQLEGEINGKKYTSDTGTIRYTVTGSGIGLQRYKGVLFVRNNDEVKQYPFQSEYFVAPPAVVMSPTNMNVFYTGIDNPVEIAVPGASLESVTPQVKEGQLTITKNGPGKFTIRPTKTGKSVIDVFADFNGQKRLMGSLTYRCKRIPNVQPYIGKYEGTNVSIPRDELLAATRLAVKIPDFEFNVNFTVTSFLMKFTDANQNVSRADGGPGGTFNDEIKRKMQGLRKGQRINIEDIVVKKPDGSTETISMSIKIL